MNKRINKKNKTLPEYIHDFIIEIRKPTYMTPFKAPVDPKEVPHYYVVIKSPMDLSTMFQKLLDGKYHLLSEVKDDFQLMITNCEAYNPPNTWIRPICDKFKSNLEKSWLKLLETLEKKGIDPNKPIEKLPELEENKEVVYPDLGFKTRNQMSLISNESIHSLDVSNKMEAINLNHQNSNSNNFNTIININNNINANVDIDKPDTNIINNNNNNSSNTNRFSINIPRPNPNSSNNPNFSNYNDIINNNNETNNKEMIKTSTEIIPTPTENLINLIEQHDSKILPEPLPLENQIENTEDLVINLNISDINNNFQQYTQHKLRKYKKIIQKTINKLLSLLTTLEIKDKPQNLEFPQILKELNNIKNGDSVDYNQICLSLVKSLFWLKKTHSKINESKAIRRILAYFSSIYKSLKRVNSLSKRIKALSIPINEEIFHAQDLGLSYYRESIYKIQAIFNIMPSKALDSITNSTKITLPKPPKEKNEIEQALTLLKHPKKLLERPNITFSSSPSMKIVMNKDLNKIKPLSLDKPQIQENKTDRLFSWAAGLNQKIQGRIDGIFQERLISSTKELLNQNENKLNNEKIPDFKEENYFNTRENLKESPMFEERKQPIEINFCSRVKQENFNVFNKNSIDINEEDQEDIRLSDLINYEMPKEKELESHDKNLFDYSLKSRNFKETLISKKIAIKLQSNNSNNENNMNKNYNINNNNKENESNLPKITIEEIWISSLFREFDEIDRISFEEIVKSLKTSNNEKLKYQKNEKIVDKSSKSLNEISQEITLDKIFKISFRVQNTNEFYLSIENRLNIESLELFTDLKRIQKINELNLLENSDWLSFDVLSKKLMKNQLYDALLNQLIKVSRFNIDPGAGIYYSVEKVNNDCNGVLVVIWSAVEKFMDFKLSVNDFKVL